MRKGKQKKTLQQGIPIEIRQFRTTFGITGSRVMLLIFHLKIYIALKICGIQFALFSEIF